MLADASSEATTEAPPKSLLDQLRLENGANTADLLVRTAAALKVARMDGSTDIQRVAATALADEARESTFSAIGAIEAADDGTGEPVTFHHRCAWLGAYSLASIQWADASLLASGETADGGRAALRAVDLALLRGGPHWNTTAKGVLARAEQAMHADLAGGAKRSNGGLKLPADLADADGKWLERQRAGRGDIERATPLWAAGDASPNVMEIPRIEYLTPEQFLKEHLKRSDPVVITNAMGNWPALCPSSNRCWSDSEYLARAAGGRIVPVETWDATDGTQTYLSKSWRQEVMTLGGFIEEKLGMQANSQSPAGGGRPAYLAQHPLFDQIPALRADIAVPKLCSTTLPEDGPDASTVHLNAWFGPEATVSPLHYDPYHNLLCQVVGHKYVRLVDAKHSGRMYRRPPPRHNNSFVDLDCPDLETYSRFRGLPMRHCVLGPGDMLYIPRHCWHYVRSLTKSFSVSFWWGGKQDMPLGFGDSAESKEGDKRSGKRVLPEVAEESSRNTGQDNKRMKAGNGP
jgi:lysine-specific demethylase 8